MKYLVPAGLALSLLTASTSAQGNEAVVSSQPLLLKYASFDPLSTAPAIPLALRAQDQSRLWIVQFAGTPTESGRQAVRATGAQVHGYLPSNAHVVRMSAGQAARVGLLEDVRWVGRYEPAFRLEAEIVTELATGDVAPRRYNVVAVDKTTDKAALAAKIEALGGTVDDLNDNSIYLEATLDAEQLVAAAHLDETLWIDRWTPAEEDMNNARIQGGGNYVESVGGYTGNGVRGHVYEGVEASHPDFNNTPINIFSNGAAQSHGHATAGIVFGNGTSNSDARGMAPDAQPYYTNYNTVTQSRWNVAQELVNNRDCQITTASWGNSRTTQYTSISADSDDIIFDHGIIWTQSQSNAGNPQSRPQAWAKNIMSIGGVRHFDNANPADDDWGGGGSTGPAADGRIKPDLCSYYDSIHTSDLTGSAGYSGGNSTTSFGGTSGATPIVSGHNILAWQMFTDGVFGNAPRVPGGTRWQNRPKFTTHKALMIANAAQYSFNAGSTTNRREHVGWGFPDLRSTWDNRSDTFIIDETCVIVQGQTQSYTLNVTPSTPELKIVLSFADPAGNPAASQAAINNLSLRVTAPNGTSYWGNNGLSQGNYSVAGGSENTVDTVECVFVQNPAVGNWTVEVIATRIAQDSHVETGATDADYGLVAKGATGSGGCVVITPGTFQNYGAGCAGSATAPACYSVNNGGGTLSGATNGNEYAYPLTATSASTIVSVEVFARSAGGGNVSVPIAVYGAGPGTTPLASTNITIGGAQAWYSATLPAPINVPAGQFFVAVDNAGGPTVLSNLTSGSQVASFWRRPGQGWSQSGVVLRPAARACVQGGGSNLVPQLNGQGNPLPGAAFSMNLSDARANAPATLFTGVSDTAWIGGSLPFSLAGLGAAGCSLLASTEIAVPTNTNANGDASITINVPNVSSLTGIVAYQQFLVLDPPANSLGVVTTNAAEVTIGG